MTAPVRLLDGAGDAYTRDLLSSAVVLDDPDAAALERVLTGVAAGGVIATMAGTAAAHTASTAGIATATAQALSSGKASALAIVVKWIGIGAVGGIATAGGASYLASVSKQPAPARPALVVEQPQPAREPVKSAPSRSASGADPEGVLEPSEAPKEDVRVAGTGERARAPARGGSTNAPLSATPNALAIDVAHLDRARSALAHGDTNSALQALDTYAATHRTGVLEREATILRIDALVSQGDRARAVRLARRYLEQFPHDPHAQRLEQLVAGAKD